jgi:DNA polymerase-3 subunit epsilon
MGVAEDSILTRDSAVLPEDLVFVDLETTGGNPAHHRITEVGIVRMQRGAVIEEWSSLVNPECTIPPYIERFTGITNDMVADAPRFAEIAAVVREKLGSAVFVAHNARFDYAFLRTEFRRLDMFFSAKVLCTVKLSRRLYPEFIRHNLDAIMERHQLSCTARHRALGDARVLSDFWAKLRSEIPQDRLAQATAAVVGAKRLPPHFPDGLADELPEGPGVYRFFDANHVLLYIGRSASLRTRILGHFAAENTDAAAENADAAAEKSDAKEQKKALAVRHIDWVETAGILGAQLKEVQWIKAQQPLYNRRVKQGSAVTLQVLPAGQGVRYASIDDLEPKALAGCYGVFQSAKDVRKALTDIARAHSLCPKILRLEEAEGSCLAAQVGKCKGACIGLESLMLHDIRVHLALSSLKFKPWPFPGRIALAEGVSVAQGKPAEGSTEYHVLDGWTYLGTARSDEELADLATSESPAAFDVDTYRILARHFAKYPDLHWRDLRRPPRARDASQTSHSLQAGRSIPVGRAPEIT